MYLRLAIAILSITGLQVVPSPTFAQSLEQRRSLLNQQEEFIYYHAQRQQAELNRLRQRQEQPVEQLPEAFTDPWIFEPTLQRRADEKDWPQAYRAKRQQEMRKIKPEMMRIPWFAAVSQQYSTRKEVQQKFQWLSDSNSVIAKKLDRMKSLRGVARKVLEKEIRHDIELAERLTCKFLNCRTPKTVVTPKRKAAKVAPQPIIPKKPLPPPAIGASTPSSKRKSSKPILKKMTGFASGLLYQIGLHHETLEMAAKRSSHERKLAAAKKAFGDGKAGGGGVSLHKAATIKGLLDVSQVERTIVEGGRLTLVMRNGDHVKLPNMLLDDIALAIRVIDGKTSVIPGTLTAVDGQAIVFKTGPKRFGDVIWRLSNLPSPPTLPKKGGAINLEIAPAVGLMELPEPSMGRVTFYGDIKNRHIGKVLAEADHAIGHLFFGVDALTGKFSPPPDAPGYMALIEIKARNMAGELSLPKWGAGKSPDPADKYKTAWWRGGTFFVWVPDKMEFIYRPSLKKVVPVNASIKLDIWTAHPSGLRAMEIKVADFVNANFNAVAARHTALLDLVEVAKVVSLVRWLKQNNIATDLSWAERRVVAKIETVDRVRQISVFPVLHKGKPQFRKAGGR